MALREPEGRLDGGLRDPLEDQRLDHVGVDAPICLVADVENAVSRRVEDLGGVLMCLEAHSALPGLAGVAREDLLHPGVPRHRFLVDAAVERDLGFASREREAGTEDADVGVGTLRHLVPEHRVLLELGERLRPEILHEQLARIGVGDDEQSCRRMRLGDAVLDLSLRCAIAHALGDLVLVPRRRLVPLEDELLHPDRDTRLGRLHDHEQMSLLVEQVQLLRGGVIRRDEEGDESESLGHHLDGSDELVPILLLHHEDEGALMQLHRVDERSDDGGTAAAEGDLGRECGLHLDLLSPLKVHPVTAGSACPWEGQCSNLSQKPNLVNLCSFCYPLAIARSG